MLEANAPPSLHPTPYLLNHIPLFRFLGTCSTPVCSSSHQNTRENTNVFQCVVLTCSQAWWQQCWPKLGYFPDCIERRHGLPTVEEFLVS